MHIPSKVERVQIHNWHIERVVEVLVGNRDSIDVSRKLIGRKVHRSRPEGHLWAANNAVAMQNVCSTGLPACSDSEKSLFT